VNSEKWKVKSEKRMPLIAALEVLLALRRGRIVVTTMGATREWARLSHDPLDFHYLPSAMGHAPLLGLGLALAQPAREVIAFNGDGGMLMGLGGLVTIAAARPANYTLIVLENGIYEVTGGQTTAGSGTVDFAAMGLAAGLTSVREFDDLDTWRLAAAECLAMPSPRMIVLHVEPVGSNYQLPTLEPAAGRLERFCAALAAG
jgi:thiamine pyrophosphate-dependent acetolactate synthase large subunit-like protein